MALKQRFVFLFILLVMIVVITTIATVTIQVVSHKVTGVYREIEEKQNSAYLGDFNEGRAKKASYMNKQGEIGGKSKEQSREDENIVIGEMEKKDQAVYEEKAEEPQNNDIFYFYALLAAAIFVVFKILKKKKVATGHRRVDENVKEEKVAHSGCFVCTNVVEATTEDGNNEIRRLFKEWQGGLRNDQMKRSHETIQEWFDRIEGPTELIPIYEKVRYGNHSFSRGEYELFFLRLRNFSENNI